MILILINICMEEKIQKSENQKLDNQDNQKKESIKTKSLAILVTILFIITTVLLISIAAITITKQNPFIKPLIGSKSNECLSYIQEKSIYKLPDGQQFATCDDAVKSLGDKYSEYFDEAEYRKFIDSVNNTYSGIGVAIEQKKTEADNTSIFVSKVFDNSAAKSAGLKPLDEILEVNKASTKNKTTSEVSSTIRGEEGSKVTLKIKSEGIEKELDITRRKIEIPVVESKQIGDLGVISISTFSEKLYEEFNSKTKSLQNNDSVKKIVIDLRDNGGGSLDSAINLIGAFTPKGTHAVTEILKNDKKIFNTPREPIFQNKKVIILINNNTASASEITTITLKEKINAVVVGEESYGKGVVQQLIPLSGNDVIKLTIAQWSSPNGFILSPENKIQPNIKLELKDPTFDDKTINKIKDL